MRYDLILWSEPRENNNFGLLYYYSVNVKDGKSVLDEW